MTKDLPPPELLRKLLDYNPDTGLLTWLPRDDLGLSGVTLRSVRAFNTRYVGKEALGYIHADGYKIGAVLGKDYIAHRLIWAMIHGECPDKIYHKNGIKHDNRIENLQVAP
jgi:hypothetical protein